MSQILKQARTAAEQENWLEVCNYLRRLPLGKKENSTGELSELAIADAIELAIQVLHQGDFQQRWDIAKLLPKLGEGVVAPLLTILEDEQEDSEVRWFAGRTLGEYDDPAVVISLVKLLQNPDTDEELAAMAAQALGNLGTSAIEELSKLLLPKLAIDAPLVEEQTRLLAVQALAQIRRSEAIEPLLQVVSDRHPEIRTAAIEALSSFHDRRITSILIKALQDPAKAVRKEAAIGLSFRTADLAEFDLVNQIKPLLNDLSIEVCRQAAIALGRFGTDEAADALFRVLKSAATPLVLKIDLVRALAWAETTASLEYLQEGLRWSAPEVCRQIITLLGRVKSPTLKAKATQILIEFLYSGQNATFEATIKQAIATSLGQLGEAQAIEALEKLAGDPERVVKLHAIAALKKLSLSDRKSSQPQEKTEKVSG
ncbi:MAG: HEAT repeat domain-containing protein [Oscillatoria sp. PMC 1051.18]|nr:HEAT repeat domain-containing protein [Oscillatoria sp. PMC 1050.18]MEC5029322.1 HEAT repeat domain-containing protein [Oscillatoria sp. PMC 1051.18]